MTQDSSSFNAFSLLFLWLLLLYQGSCFMMWIAWWWYQLQEPLSSLDVCDHHPQTALFPHLCQHCCLWSCTEPWIREAVQVKNNPVSGWGWQKLPSSNVVCSQVSENWAVAGRQESAASERLIFYKKCQLFSQLKEPCEWGERNPLTMVICDKRANFTVHRHYHKLSSHELYFSGPWHDGFAAKANDNIL